MSPSPPERHRVGAQPVTPGASDLLIIALDAAGQIGMADVAHVRLVDTHAEGDRRDHHDAGPMEERILIGISDAGIETGMIGQRVDALGRELVREPLDALARRAIDDAALALVAADEVHDLPRRIVLTHESQMQVRPVERADEDARFAAEQFRHDLVAGARIGAGGHRDDRRIAERGSRGAQVHVFRAEVVAPLRDAMCLVDGEAVDAGLAQPVERPGLQQALRRHVEQPHRTRLQRRLDDRIVGVGISRMQRAGDDAAIGQLAHLVAHQRDQRRHHDGQLAAHHRGELVAQRFSGAGRHHGEHILTGEQRFYDLGLTGA